MKIVVSRKNISRIISLRVAFREAYRAKSKTVEIQGKKAMYALTARSLSKALDFPARINTVITQKNAATVKLRIVRYL
jgi:hypothetical protein